MTKPSVLGVSAVILGLSASGPGGERLDEDDRTHLGHRDEDRRVDADFGVPDDFLALNARPRARAVWRIERSGFPVIPNEVHASVDELAVSDGVTPFGLLWKPDYGSNAAGRASVTSRLGVGPPEQALL